MGSYDDGYREGFRSGSIGTVFIIFLATLLMLPLVMKAALGPCVIEIRRTTEVSPR